MGRAYSCWMLNCWCITWPVGFKRLILEDGGSNVFRNVKVHSPSDIVLYPPGPEPYGMQFLHSRIQATCPTNLFDLGHPANNKWKLNITQLLSVEFLQTRANSCPLNSKSLQPHGSPVPGRTVPQYGVTLWRAIAAWFIWHHSSQCKQLQGQIPTSGSCGLLFCWN